MVDKKKIKKKKEDIVKNSRIEKNKKQRKDIAKKEHIENTVNVTKIVIKVLIVLIIIFSVIYVCCRYIGTSGLIIKEYSIDYDTLPDSFYGLKIIQISDINYNKKTMPIKRIESLVDKVNSLKPDIIIFTGNLVYDEITKEESKQLEECLIKLESTIGKYAVFWEDSTSSKIIIKNAGFHDLENTYDLVYKENYDPILINGISSNNPDVDSSFSYFDLENADNNIFTISLVHKSDMAIDILNKREVNLILSGNSLGGQINIPKVGGIIKTDGSKEYIDNYYRINNTDLYVSSGIGTRKYPYRLFNHPSINLFRLK